MKKFLLVIIFVSLFCFAAMASAMTTQERDALIAQLQQSIIEIQAQITQLLQQIQQQTTQTTTTTTPGLTTPSTCHTFNINLGFAQSGSNEVKELKTYLIKDGVMPYQAVDATYDEQLVTYVFQFQQKYGISQPNGYFGPQTRAKMNALFGCNYNTNLVPVTTSVCTSINYSDWSTCSEGGVRSRSIISALPVGCNAGNVILSESCTPVVQQPSNQTVRTSITVTSPNGGENWNIGETHAITWTSSGIIGNVSISLEGYTVYTSGQWLPYIIATVPASSGSYSWRIASQIPGGDYKIKISYTDNINPSNGAVDYSNESFAISARPTITIASPNGGESWMQGTSHLITWSSQGMKAENDVLHIYLNNAAGQRVSTIASNVSQSLNSYPWVIPSTLPLGNYKVEIWDSYGLTQGWNISDVSNNYFSVVAPTSSVVVTSPAEGENWTAGTVHAITWTSAQYTGCFNVYLRQSTYSYNGTLLTNACSGNVYNWNIPTNLTTANNYSIRVVATGLSTTDTTIGNSATFTITAPNVQSTCFPEWQIGPWGACKDGTQTRNIIDIKNCGTTIGKPSVPESQSCSVPVVCTPNWQCSDWGPCGAAKASKQVQTCVDSNSCGVAANNTKTLERDCSSKCWRCTNWNSCGVIVSGNTTLSNYQTRTCVAAADNECDYQNNKCVVGSTEYCQSAGEIGTGAWSGYRPSVTQKCTSTCSPYWECTGWGTCEACPTTGAQACLGGRSAKRCYDKNVCGIYFGDDFKGDYRDWKYNWYFDSFNYIFPGTNTAYKNCEVGVTYQPGCKINYVCGSWSACKSTNAYTPYSCSSSYVDCNGTKSRTCSDTNKCANSYTETVPCLVPPDFTKDPYGWKCGDWSTCDGVAEQTRTCYGAYLSTEKRMTVDSRSCEATRAANISSFYFDNGANGGPVGLYMGQSYTTSRILSNTDVYLRRMYYKYLTTVENYKISITCPAGVTITSEQTGAQDLCNKETSLVFTRWDPIVSPIRELMFEDYVKIKVNSALTSGFTIKFSNNVYDIKTGSALTNKNTVINIPVTPYNP